MPFNIINIGQSSQVENNGGTVNIDYGNPKKPEKEDSHEDEYVDFEEIKDTDVVPQTQEIKTKDEDPIVSAIQQIMELKDAKGVYVFKYATQWQAIYRILVDYKGWPTEYRAFTKQVNELSEWRIPCSEIALQPIGENYFHKPYKQWNLKDSEMKSAIYNRLTTVAAHLVNILNISI